MSEPFVAYEPEEDTYLILEHLRHYAFGTVLDMGTGTGILAVEASRTADFVIGCDINKKALKLAEKNAADIPNIKFVYSDLFSYFRKNPLKFDLVVFNPPYLPEHKEEEKEVALAVSGGKHGYEILDRFFDEASSYLKPDGRILIVFSTLTKKDKVNEILQNHGFNFQKLSEKEIAFETLYVYLCEKSDLLRELEQEGISSVRKIAKGHRGIIYTGLLNKKKIVVKAKLPQSKAVARMQNEARWLKVLNKYKIGPEFIMHNKEWFAYYYVDGIFFPEFIKKADKSNIKKVIRDVFEQMQILDKKNINKEEMHKPYKHILIKNNKAVLLDFERTHVTKKPHNITQFCQYIISKSVSDVLKKKGLKINRRKIITLAGKYKKDMSEENFRNIMKHILQP